MSALTPLVFKSRDLKGETVPIETALAELRTLYHLSMYDAPRLWEAARGHSPIDYNKRGRRYNEQEMASARAVFEKHGVPLTQTAILDDEQFRGCYGPPAKECSKCERGIPHSWQRHTPGTRSRSRAKHMLTTDHGMDEIGTFRLDGVRFRVNTSREIDEAVYAMTIDDEIVRIGTSDGPVSGRLRSYEQSITEGLLGLRAQTLPCEAREWQRRLLTAHDPVGRIYAAQGPLVENGSESYRAFLDKERYLLALYRPPMNRSHR